MTKGLYVAKAGQTGKLLSEGFAANIRKMEENSAVWLLFLSLGITLFFVALNAFFVAAEFSIIKVRRTRLEELAGQGVTAAKISILCIDRLGEYLSATQLGITISSLALGGIGEWAFSTMLLRVLPEHVFDPAKRHLIAVSLSFFAITLLHVVLGELVPKSMAIQKAEKITLLVARPLHFFYLVTRPFIRSFSFIASVILKRFGYSSYDEPPLTENELKLVMKESKEDGIISDSEAQIITRAFEFADKRAMDILVPADKVDFISLSWPFEKNMEVVRQTLHTRFPLCEKGFDTVKGTVHMKDVWPQLLKQFSNEAFEKSARAPIFVSSGLRQDQLMRLFQSCRAHLAVVQDPNNNQNMGIVTLEDILEGLVGDIRDEHGN